MYGFFLFGAITLDGPLSSLFGKAEKRKSGKISKNFFSLTMESNENHPPSNSFFPGIRHNGKAITSGQPPVDEGAPPPQSSTSARRLNPPPASQKFCSSCKIEISIQDPHPNCLRHNKTCFRNFQFDPTNCEHCDILFFYFWNSTTSLA